MKKLPWQILIMIPLYIWKWQMALFFESSSAFPTVLPNVDYSYFTFKTSDFKTI
jgi:hypothetical protein